MSNRFLERQLNSAESKKLGRTERFYDYDAEKNEICEGERRGDAATRPPNVTAGAYPVGRTMGIAKPGSEDQMGRVRPGYAEVAGARPALKKYRKPNR